MSTSSIPNVAIFGATGGCCFATLRHCLATNLPVTVLVRNQSKLFTMLKIAEAPSNLRIITGNINSAADVKATITTPSGEVADIIVSGIGFVPGPSKKGFSLDIYAGVEDLQMCEKATRSILKRIEEVKAESNVAKEPLVVVISTTGISSAGRDLPLMMVPLYHALGAPPHKDKKAMEEVLINEAPAGLNWVIVRPSLLMGDGIGEGKGMSNVRVGIERNGKFENKAIGYTILRQDVGEWIFKNLVEKTDKDLIGCCVGLTS